MLYNVAYFQLKTGKGREFQEWWSENRGKFEAMAPGGAKLVGVFAPIYGGEDEPMQGWWQFENYAAFDTWAAKKDDKWFRLWDEMLEFVDSDKPSKSVLVKDLEAVTIFAEAKPED